MARSPQKPSSSSSFHAPFADLGRDLKKDLRRRRKRSEVASNSPASVPSAESSTRGSESERPEDLFEATVGPVRQLDGVGVHKDAGLVKASTTELRESPGFSHSSGREARAAHEQFRALDTTERFDLSFCDGYVRALAPDVDGQTVARLERGEFSRTTHIDLHGLTLDGARLVVDDFMREQQSRGSRCVLVITGKGQNSPTGRGVLREAIPEWLVQGPSARRILALVSARPCDGGEGAIYVLLRS